MAPLGTLVKTLIGVVTGANAFFVRSWPEVEALGKGLSSVPIVSRRRMAGRDQLDPSGAERACR